MEHVEYDHIAPEDHLLGVLDVVAHRLATAESAGMLSLGLEEFLALWRTSRGLVLTRPEGAAGVQVAAAQHTPEDLAESFTYDPCLWMPSGGAYIPIDANGSGTSGFAEAPSPLAQCLAEAGMSWFAWLPLTLSERVEAVLVALGNGERPSAAEQDRACLAGALLGDLVTAALERDQLRQLVARNEHARDEFIGLASHELKSPLTVIKGYSQLLLRQARRGNAGGTVDLNGLEAISHQVSRMSTLVGELLDFSRIERGTLEIEPAPVDVVALVRQIIEQRQRALPDITFYLTASEPELIALADRIRLEQALGYLLDNAVKFGHSEGVVEVVVQRSQAMLLPPASEAATAEAPQGEVARVSIRDYGPGLPDEERKKLFTAFYRGPANSFQRQLAGLGLGLYLSHHLVVRQNGQLWADFPLSSYPPGSIFNLTLPLPSAS